MDALILSCGTGGGHDAAGHALEEALFRAGHRVVMMNPYRLRSEKLARRIDRTYITLVQRTRRGFGAVYKLGDVVRRVPGRSPVYAANRGMTAVLAEYLAAHPVDVVFMPHLFPAEIFTAMKRKGMTVPKFVFVATDYACIPFTEETECDAYVVPSADLVPEFESWGIPSEKIYPLGIPVKKAFADRPNRDDVRASLGLLCEEKYILLSGGSMGAGEVETVIDHLMELSVEMSKAVVPIVVCGNNDRLYQRLHEQYGERLLLLHTTDRMADYLHAVDLYMTKPGGLSTTEAAVAGVPLVHLPPIPGCETRNARYFRERGMSLRLGADRADVARALSLLSDAETCDRMVAAQRATIPSSAADDIVKTFCSM